MQKKKKTQSAWLCLAGLFGLCFLLGRPQQAVRGTAHGLTLCVQVIIPTMFPFFVCSRLVLQSRLRILVQRALAPLTACLGISQPEAAQALVCGMTGGFAAGAKSVGQLYANGLLSKRQAERLLIATTVAGPSFVIGTVGAELLRSPAAGWALFAAQCVAALMCALAARWIDTKRGVQDSCMKPCAHRAEKVSLAEIIEDSVKATAVLCGYVTLFSFFAAIAELWQGKAAYVFACFLEVTTACAYAVQQDGESRLMLCAAALSIAGTAVFVQVKAFAGKELSIRPLVASRMLHLPLMLAMSAWLSRLPTVSAPAVCLGEREAVMRMPADAACVAFVLCALVFCGKQALPEPQKRL